MPYGPWRVASDQGEATVRVVTTAFELFLPTIETAPLSDDGFRTDASSESRLRVSRT
jgi:hypothetical protein